PRAGAQDHRRVGLRGPEARRPAPERRGAMPQPGAQACASGRILRKTAGLLENGVRHRARDQSPGRGRVLPLWHLVRLPYAAVYEPGAVVRPAVLVA
ncbi:hypothetical protein LTR94_036423, partial [Friedmanniomyces endolithicus]